MFLCNCQSFNKRKLLLLLPKKFPQKIKPQSYRANSQMDRQTHWNWHATSSEKVMTSTVPVPQLTNFFIVILEKHNQSLVNCTLLEAYRINRGQQLQQLQHWLLYSCLPKIQHIIAEHFLA